MYDLEILKNEAQEILDISSLTEQNVDLLNEIVNNLLQKMDLCVGIPIINILSLIHI